MFLQRIVTRSDFEYMTHVLGHIVEMIFQKIDKNKIFKKYESFKESLLHYQIPIHLLSIKRKYSPNTKDYKMLNIYDRMNKIDHTDEYFEYVVMNERRK